MKRFNDTWWRRLMQDRTNHMSRDASGKQVCHVNSQCSNQIAQYLKNAPYQKAMEFAHMRLLPK